MRITPAGSGILKVGVGSQGAFIHEGTSVQIFKVVDDNKNLFVHVQSELVDVKLNYLDTDIDWLLGKK